VATDEPTPPGGGLVPSSFNPNLFVDHNRIAQNGSFLSGGGGLAFYSGTDGYRVQNNFICGNFSSGYGGGIGHFGLSDGTRPPVAYPAGFVIREPVNIIENNVVVSNESADEGGGIHVGGENAPGAVALSAGAGSVVINRNLIQGNKGGDDGGGIRTRRFNGTDVSANRSNPANWWTIDIYNNMIVNNSSADHGGGLSFDDTVRANVVGNTIARNDSTSTGSDAFGGPCTENSPVGQLCPAHEAIGGLTTSIPQVGGVASFTHTSALYAALTGAGSFCAANPGTSYCASFSNPLLKGNIVWQNRCFYWDATGNGGLGLLVPCNVGTTGPPSDGYWDFAVYGLPPSATCTAANCLVSTYSILTNGVGTPTDGTNRIGADPGFVSTYFNNYQATSKGAALGNFVVATFTPNGVQGNYHLSGIGSPAFGGGDGLTAGLKPFNFAQDYDGQTRVAPTEIGADQLAAPRPAARAGGGVASAKMSPAPAAAAVRTTGRGGVFREPLVDIGLLDARQLTRQAISISATALDFGPVSRGTSSAAQLLRVTNSSDSDVTVSRSLAGSGQFTTLIDGKTWRGDSRTVPAHGSLTIGVAFAPREGFASEASGLLTLHASGLSSHRVSLAGTAQ
jgi:large repetitive protein